MPRERRQKARWPHILIHVAALIPLAVLIWLFVWDQLGPAPVAAVIQRLGRYALVLLLLSLLPTAIRTVTNYRAPANARRTLGLYAFLYAALHVVAFAGLDYGFGLRLLAIAVLQSRREIVGLVSLLILALLALTSAPPLKRRLGDYWRPLHRLVYVAAALVVLHYTWNYKELRTWPVLAGMALLTLLAARLPLIARLLDRRRDA